ncbi:MAG: histidine kinase, partial [Bacteroidales bacterium]|nr:histidine kinase [Bacteroidales bacterium]
MKWTFSLIIFLLIHLLTPGQIPNQTRQKTVDSLFILLKKANGLRKVDLLNSLALNLSPRSFDSGMRYAREALYLSGSLDYIKGKGIATFNIGNCYYFKRDIKNALTNYLTALRILEPFEPSREIGNLLLQLGSVNEYVRNTKKVTAYFQRAASNFAVIGDSVATMLAYFTLGSSYYYKIQTLDRIDTLTSEPMNSMIDSALKYNGIVLSYVIRHPDILLLPDLYNNQGLYYQVKHDSSTPVFFYKSLQVCFTLQDTNVRNIMEGLEHMNLGFYYYYHLRDMEMGYSHSLQAAELLKKTDRYDLYAGALLTLGEIDTDRGRYHRAGKYLHQGLNLSDTFLIKIGQIIHTDPGIRIWGITQMRSWRVDCFRDLVRFYELSGDYRHAHEYQKKLEEEKNILTLNDLNRQILGLEADYEDEIKRQEIRGLIKDNELNRFKMIQNRIFFAAIGGALLTALLILTLWIQRKRFLSDQKALILEQKLLRSQMNPHFIFNSLTNIQNFILTEKPDKASIYLSKFAMLVRNILDNSVEEYVVL